MFAQESMARRFSVLLVMVFLLAVTLAVMPLQAAHADGPVRYAKPGGTGDCSSWANACTLQTALTGATSGQEIWAATGVYTPTAGADRAATFQLINGVAVYGGFAATETLRTERSPAANVTILSGDIDNDDTQTPIITDTTTVSGNTTNSYHVVTGATGATLDGFTITAGNANASSGPSSEGGGMHNTSSSPTLTNLTFSGNSAGTVGGGMLNTSSSPTLTNVTFRGNAATIYGGGGMFNWYSSPTLTNVTFINNSSANYGGGMYNGYSSPMLTNVTFSGNSATSGGGMANYTSGNPQVRNTVVWGNTPYEAQIWDGDSTPSVSDSVVQGGYAGTNIITDDPKLGALGNYGGWTQTVPLQAGSSAIDMGNDSDCPATDQRGISRPQGAHCDIGAFELEIYSIYLPLVVRF
jgi:predicted outer membrane repeat protein